MKLFDTKDLDGGKILVFFKGTPQTRKYYNEFLGLANILPYMPEIDIKSRGWIFRKEDLKYIEAIDQKAFPRKQKKTMQEKLKGIASQATTKTVEGWESIGQGMKLAPYDYQKKVVKFIVDKHGDGCHDTLIVAPCGSGKTPMGIAAYLECHNRGIVEGPGMIVVKASLKTQWAKEVKKFSDLDVKIVQTYSDCIGREKQMLDRREKKLCRLTDKKEIAETEQEIKDLKRIIKDKFKAQFEDADLFVLNYETLLDEKVQKAMLKVAPQYVFSDESHYIKGAGNKRSKALAKFNGAKVKIGATATPVQRDPRDIYGIFKFVHPELFRTAKDFNALYVRYGYGYQVIGARNEAQLNKKIDPYMFILSKQEVASHLPQLVVSQRYCEFEPEQAEVNQEMMDELDEMNEKAKVIARGKSEEALKSNQEYQDIQCGIQARQTFLQELTLSEELLKTSDSDIAKRLITKSESQKLKVLKDMVEEIIESGEKVCIFSRFARMQQIITEAFASSNSTTLKKAGIAYIRGELSSEQRYEEAYTKFRDNDEYKVLICSDAGAEGLNLSLCKYMIEMEPAVSYAIQTQRHGRLERADSVHDTVFVTQLVIPESWDEIMLKSITKKEKYDESIVRGLISAE